MLGGAGRDRPERTAAPRGRAKANWKAHGGEAASTRCGPSERRLADAGRRPPARVAASTAELVVGAICGRFVLDGAGARAAAGTLEFHDLLVLARRLLATDDGARRRLHERYRRLLLDEFQDTDPIQLEIAVRLTADPDGQPTDAPAACEPLPGRLFVVGDPKQSIYRFRRADIAIYLAAADQIGAEREVLSANFRSTDAVIDWVNGVFGEVIQPEPDVQPAYGPLDACRPGAARPRLGARARRRRARRRRRRRRGAAASGRPRRSPPPWPPPCATGWPVGDGDGGLRPCRARRHRRAAAGPHVAADARAGPGRPRAAVPGRERSVVYLAPEIRDLMLALRAAADPTDELALVAALRSPLYGCSDVELLDWRAGGRPLRARSPTCPTALADHRVGRGDRPRPRRSPVTSAGRRRPSCSTASSSSAGCSRPPSPAPMPATCGGGSASSSTRPGRGPTPAGAACGATCAGRRTRPPRVGPATRSCPSATTTRCG